MKGALLTEWFTFVLTIVLCKTCLYCTVYEGKRSNVNVTRRSFFIVAHTRLDWHISRYIFPCPRWFGSWLV